MTTAQERKQALIEHEVITDVLPGELELNYDLTVKWLNATLEKGGELLDREDTQSTPTVHLHPNPSEPLKNLVLLMVDPDLMMNKDTYFGQVRHWLVTNVSTSITGELSLPTDSTVSPYVGPAPLLNYLYARPHRYVFVLASSSSPVTVTNDDLRELQKTYTAAMAGNQEAQDIKDRWGFDVRKLIEMKGLKVEAVNFMRVGGTVKSAAAHGAMLAQSLANKAGQSVGL